MSAWRPNDRSISPSEGKILLAFFHKSLGCGPCVTYLPTISREVGSVNRVEGVGIRVRVAAHDWVNSRELSEGGEIHASAHKGGVEAGLPFVGFLMGAFPSVGGAVGSSPGG